MQQLIKNKNGLFILAFLIILLTVTFATVTGRANAEVHIAESTSTQQASSVPPSCRYGTMKGKSGNTSFVSHMTTLNAGAYYYYDAAGHANVNYDNSNSNIPERIQNIDIEAGVLGKGGVEFTDAEIISKVENYNNTNGTNVNRGGGIWIIGNEMERSVQGNTTPTQFAQAYQRAYSLIKLTDPTAQVAPGGIVQVTPARLQYLNQFVQAYQSSFGSRPPVDIWTIHAYMLPEVDGSGLFWDAGASFPVGVSFNDYGNLGKRHSDYQDNRCNNSSDNIWCASEYDNVTMLQNQVIDFRTWMKNNGYREKPLIITEFSILTPEYTEDVPSFASYYGASPDDYNDEFNGQFTYARSATYFDAASSYFESATSSGSNGIGYSADNGKLVQQWFWYAVQVNDSPPLELGASYFGASRLFKKNGLISDVGVAFRNRATSGSGMSNIYLTSPASVNTTAAIQSGATFGTASVNVSFRDNGDIGDGSTTVVARVKNSAGTVVKTTNIPGIRGCATHDYQPHITFSVPSGGGNFTVELVSGSQIETVNVVVSTFSVTSRIYLPLIK